VVPNEEVWNKVVCLELVPEEIEEVGSIWKGGWRVHFDLC